MDLSRYSHSEGFFNSIDPLIDPNNASFDSWRGRGIAFLAFLEKGAIVPFAFFFKLYKTFFRALGVAFSLFCLAITLCSSEQIRAMFVRRVSSLAQDLADWIIWPVAVLGCLCRLLLAATLHPALYYSSF